MKYVTKKSKFFRILKKQFGTAFFSLSEATDIYQVYVNSCVSRPAAMATVSSCLNSGGAERGSKRGLYRLTSPVTTTPTTDKLTPIISDTLQPATSLTPDEALQLVMLFKKLFTAV